MTKTNQVKTFMTNLYCDNCDEKMEKTGLVYCSYPSRYEYECPRCGYKILSSIDYPEIHYKSINE